MVKVLLVIECQNFLNWYQVFQGARLRLTDDPDDEGEEIQVEQAPWTDISVCAYPPNRGGAIVSIRKATSPLPGTSQCQSRVVSVDFVLLRSVTRGIKGQDSRNLLMALIHANVPAVNSLHSAYMCLERPVVFGALKMIQQQKYDDPDEFPLIGQTLYPHHREMLVTPDFPIVVKVGHAHAGYGKARLETQSQFEDFRSLCALHGDYVTCESFIDWDWDGRVQKIGDHYRVFHRTSPNWKGNTGNASIINDIEVTPQFKRWADDCAELFGGLDILGLDFLHDRVTGKYHILELNDTAIGLVHKHEAEDMGFMRDIVLTKMTAFFREKAARAARLAAAKQDAASSLSSGTQNDVVIIDDNSTAGTSTTSGTTPASSSTSSAEHIATHVRAKGQNRKCTIM